MYKNIMRLIKCTARNNLFRAVLNSISTFVFPIALYFSKTKPRLLKKVGAKKSEHRAKISCRINLKFPRFCTLIVKDTTLTEPVKDVRSTHYAEFYGISTNKKAAVNAVQRHICAYLASVTSVASVF